MTWTVGPLFIAVLPGVTSDIPLLPVSDDPMASVIMMLGRRAKNWSFTGALNSAAEETTAYREERSWLAPASSSDSISGLPMASPVIMSELTPSFSTSSHTSCGSNLAISTIFEPTKLRPMTAHWVAPCIRGATGRWVMGPVGSLLDHPARILDPRVGHGVGAAPQGVEDVLVAPYDALGHAGRAAGVEDVDVVGRAGAEVTRRRLAGQGVLVADGVR